MERRPEDVIPAQVLVNQVDNCSYFESLMLRKSVFIAKFSVIKKKFYIRFTFFQNISIMADKDGKDKGSLAIH